MTDPVFPIVQRTEVDGVPTLWIDEPGPMVASLMFRVGRCDEPTPMGGVSHIVEHLALARLGVQDYDHNGFVDGDKTVFTTIGRPDEVVEFLGSVTAALGDLPTERLLLERRILREERAQRGPSIGGALRWYRYGYAGQGRGLGPGDDELGLDWLGPEPVLAWARRWFTTGNAMLWLTGAPPSDLRLTGLPGGDRAEGPRIDTTPGVTFPAHLAWDGPGANLSMTGARSAALNVAGNIAHRRARQRLRFDQGLVYDVQQDYEPVAPGTAHVMLGADCNDERIPAVAEALLGVLRELAEDGPTAAELDGEVRAYLRQFDDRDGRIGLLAVSALDALWGEAVLSAEEFLARRQAVGPADAAGALREAMATLLILANAPAVGALPPYPSWSTTRLAGREHAPAGFFLPGRRPKERLFAGPEGLTLVLDGGWLTVPYADAVACIHDSPDTRTLLGRDGMRLTVQAPAWKDGHAVVAAIDAALPATLVACAEHGIGGLEDETPPDQDAAVSTGPG